MKNGKAAKYLDMAEYHEWNAQRKTDQKNEIVVSMGEV